MAASGVLRRTGLGALVLGAGWFAVEGGEYGTVDLWRQRVRSRELTDSVRVLSGVVDSLERYRRRVLTDPATQERIAREEFGMVKGGKELLYRFAPSVNDTGGRGGATRKPGVAAKPR